MIIIKTIIRFHLDFISQQNVLSFSSKRVKRVRSRDFGGQKAGSGNSLAVHLLFSTRFCGPEMSFVTFSFKSNPKHFWMIFSLLSRSRENINGLVLTLLFRTQTVAPKIYTFYLFWKQTPAIVFVSPWRNSDERQGKVTFFPFVSEEWARAGANTWGCHTHTHTSAHIKRVTSLIFIVRWKK